MTDQPTPDPTPTPAPTDPAAGGPTPASAQSAPPAGYVPQDALDKVEAQRRSLQGELDRLRAVGTPTPPVTPTPDPAPAPAPTPGFDPASFRRQVITDVLGATAFQRQAEELKGEFKYADPALFDPEVLSEFDSVDALRTAVEMDHKRVIDSMNAELSSRGLDPTAFWAAQSGTPAAQPSPLGPGNPGGGAVAPPLPTIEQMGQMTTSQLDALEKAHPGILERARLVAAGAGE